MSSFPIDLGSFSFKRSKNKDTQSNSNSNTQPNSEAKKGSQKSDFIIKYDLSLPKTKKTKLINKNPQPKKEYLTVNTVRFDRLSNDSNDSVISKSKSRSSSPKIRENSNDRLSNREELKVDADAQDRVQDIPINYDAFDDTIPYWAKKGNMRDANRRVSTEEDFDKTTLFIPPEEFKKLKPTMRQYWSIKQNYMDKIVFYRLGRFYEIYYDDAIICHKELDLAWVGDKLNVGFPEKHLEFNLQRLTKLGYEVVIVEQTETIAQMEQRLKSNSEYRRERLIRREPVRIVSSATFVNFNPKFYENKHVLAISSVTLISGQKVVGVSVIEMAKNIIYFGSFLDEGIKDHDYSLIYALIGHFKPQQVIYNDERIDQKYIKAIKSFSSLQPIMTNMGNENLWNTAILFGQQEIL